MGAILIVEDDEDVAALLRLRLIAAGHDVHMAQDGECGLEIAGRVRFDLVIVDWMLPGRSGIDVCRQLRRDGLHPGQILMLTARATDGDRATALAAGVDEFVTKPFSPRELVARVAGLLA